MFELWPLTIPLCIIRSCTFKRYFLHFQSFKKSSKMYSKTHYELRWNLTRNHTFLATQKTRVTKTLGKGNRLFVDMTLKHWKFSGDISRFLVVCVRFRTLSAGIIFPFCHNFGNMFTGNADFRNLKLWTPYRAASAP